MCSVPRQLPAAALQADEAHPGRGAAHAQALHVPADDHEERDVLHEQPAHLAHDACRALLAPAAH